MKLVLREKERRKRGRGQLLIAVRLTVSPLEVDFNSEDRLGATSETGICQRTESLLCSREGGTPTGAAGETAGNIVWGGRAEWLAGVHS